uniref:HMNGT n=1 Tax=Arundo donax TaxID=35708 RepID=A0A0A9ABW6_ARUDO
MLMSMAPRPALPTGAVEAMTSARGPTV